MRTVDASGNFNMLAAVVLASVTVVAVTAFILLGRLGGPSTRCAKFGGQLMVGPGGETTCISGRTFLPIEGYSTSSR